jgi:hypothetical protein
MRIIIALSLLLVACSPTWHLNRAIKKDPSIVHTQTDTIVKTISDSGEVYFYGDTMVENNFVFISVKHEGLKTNLYWYLKSIKIEFPVETTTINPQPSNFSTWQANKTIRTQIRQENRTERKDIKEDTKKIKSNNKVKKVELRTKARVEVKKLNRFRLFFFGVLVGILITFIPKIINQWNILNHFRKG